MLKRSKIRISAPETPEIFGDPDPIQNDWGRSLMMISQGDIKNATDWFFPNSTPVLNTLGCMFSVLLSRTNKMVHHCCINSFIPQLGGLAAQICYNLNLSQKIFGPENIWARKIWDFEGFQNKRVPPMVLKIFGTFLLETIPFVVRPVVGGWPKPRTVTKFPGDTTLTWFCKLKFWSANRNLGQL